MCILKENGLGFIIHRSSRAVKNVPDASRSLDLQLLLKPLSNLQYRKKKENRFILFSLCLIPRHKDAPY